MLKKLAIGLAVVIAAILLFATTKPDSFRVERSARIEADPAIVYALIDDFHAWARWSPWEELDPTMERRFSGSGSGPGAVYEWEGNRNVGRGRMEIVEASPPSRVLIDLHFLSPFESRSTSEFTLRPSGGGTDVTWAMYGPNTYLGKLMSVFVSMDRIIGGDFESGLANLKGAAEG